MEKETILCAAIHYDNGKAYVHQPKNIESGVVFCGLRHSSCLILLSIAFPKGDRNGPVIQGFITSKGMFVDREKGMKIAVKAGQVPKNGRKELFSEDLY